MVYILQTLFNYEFTDSSILNETAISNISSLFVATLSIFCFVFIVEIRLAQYEIAICVWTKVHSLDFIGISLFSKNVRQTMMIQNRITNEGVS